MTCYCSRTGVDVHLAQPGTDLELIIDPDDDLWVIFGSRAFASRPGTVREKAARVLEVFDERDLATPDVILSGGADGADAVAEGLALVLDVPMIVYSVTGPSSGTQARHEWADAPWVVTTATTYEGPHDDPTSGNGAYLTRNCLMADLAAQYDGQGFAIYNGASTGTAAMLDSCAAHGVPTTVWRYDQAGT